MPAEYELGAVIADFLGDAEAGRMRSAPGRPYTSVELRELRGALTHVTTELGDLEVDAVRSRDVRTLVDDLGVAGLPPERAGAIVDALRSVYAYALGRGLVTTSPLVGLVPGAKQAPSPTTAVLAFGERLATLMVRLMLIGFILAAVGLAVALA